MTAHSFLGLYEPAPWFIATSSSNPFYHLSALGGQFVVMTFLGSCRLAVSRQVNDAFIACSRVFDDRNACWFGVTIDPDDRSQLHERLPGIRYFWDMDGRISELYKVKPDNDASRYWPCTYILDQRLRIAAIIPFADKDAFQHVNAVMGCLQVLLKNPPVGTAPVLIVPNVLEPDFCQTLLDYYQHQGGEASGFMREENGRTVGRHDPNVKIRRDRLIVDLQLQKNVNARLARRLLPEISRAFHYRATRIERHLIACYSAEDGGFFKAHRDDTTKGTAHRQFAVSINLNAGEYEGGDLCFPEFGRQTYRAPTGGAVVFSCSLLHEATRVTQGSRYALLPFLYNEEAAQLRQQNQSFIES